VRDGRECEGTVTEFVGRGEETTKLAVQMTDLPREKLNEDVLSGTGSRWTVRSGIPAGTRGFTLLRNVQRCSGAQEVPGVLTRGYSGRGVIPTTGLHLVLWLRISGAITLLPPYIFLMAWKGTSSFLSFEHIAGAMSPNTGALLTCLYV
jgi:hypothetical protein